jgi:hypothetical protein
MTACSLAWPILAGCAGQQAKRLSWGDHTILAPGSGVANLNAAANNTANSQAERARAVFTLFAHHVRPGFSAKETAGALLDPRWLGESDLSEIVAVGGWLPVEWTANNTAFRVYLFPTQTEKPWSAWVIYFTLSGRLPDHQARSKDDALAFLRGEAGLYGDPRLEEFALCFPADPRTKQARVERFGPRGIHVSYP